MSPLMGGGEPLTTGVATTQETSFLWDGVPCLDILFSPQDRCVSAQGYESERQEPVMLNLGSYFSL